MAKLTASQFFLAAFIAGVSGIADMFVLGWVAPEKINSEHPQLMLGLMAFFFAKAFFMWIRDHQKDFKIDGTPIILIGALLLSGCASTGTILVETERGIHATLAAVDDTVNGVCDAKLRTEADCKAFNASLVAAYSAYENFNKSIQEGSVAAAPAMAQSIVDLQKAVESMAPQATNLIADLKRLYEAVKSMLPKEKAHAEIEPEGLGEVAHSRQRTAAITSSWHRVERDCWITA